MTSLASPPHILELAAVLLLTPSLTSIHLSDLGIKNQRPLKEQITEIMEKQAGGTKRREKGEAIIWAVRGVLERAGLRDLRQTNKDINYVDTLRVTLGNTTACDHNHSLSFQYKILRAQKRLERSGFFSTYRGSMRHQQEPPATSKDSVLAYAQPDSFSISRHSHCPELVFNQRWEQDERIKGRWFEKDQLRKWKIGDSCHTCQKLQYTLIFYERDTLLKEKENVNPQLHEISDVNFLR